MKDNDRLSAIFESQSPEGAFYSTIHLKERIFIDCNSFTAVQMLRALRVLPNSEPLRSSRDLAINYLKECESNVRPGTFSFWPKGKNPVWIPELPQDSDDTALITLEFLRDGIIDKRKAKEIACKILLPYRLRQAIIPSPSWIRPGVFLAWLDNSRLNVIDCCVNTNIVALLAYLDLSHLPGFDEACKMINEAIIWAGRSEPRIRSITPFYPHPAEFAIALSNAIECGAHQMYESLSLIEYYGWITKESIDNPDENWPICGSAYGLISWTSKSLQLARKLGRE